MAERTAVRDQRTATPPVSGRISRFEAPKELAESFGAQVVTEDHIQGAIKTENIREMLDAFGLEHRTEIPLPFQHMKRQHGEIWSMRVEPATYQTVDGKLQFVHTWIYTRAQPERVAGVQ
jgi:hypothetical protein